MAKRALEYDKVELYVRKDFDILLGESRRLFESRKKSEFDHCHYLDSHQVISKLDTNIHIV